MADPDGRHEDDGKWRPYSITIDLVNIPSPGSVQTIMRTLDEDKKDVNRAALCLHMNQSDFVRTAVLGAARRVLSEVAKHSKSTFPGAEDATGATKVR